MTAADRLDPVTANGDLAGANSYLPTSCPSN